MHNALGAIKVPSNKQLKKVLRIQRFSPQARSKRVMAASTNIFMVFLPASATDKKWINKTPLLGCYKWIRIIIQKVSRQQQDPFSAAERKMEIPRHERREVEMTQIFQHNTFFDENHTTNNYHFSRTQHRKIKGCEFFRRVFSIFHSKTTMCDHEKE